ncbi:hypothetical protein AGMMS49942_12970 [Spirochaetia bacterium]|nr:hypothetical protein AGMMS49942_12970 [Spirochaetia bacterium]
METTDDTEKKNGLSAKDVSLKSMIVSAVWISVLTIAKAFWVLISDKTFGLTMNEIVLSGIIMAAVFSPVYLSIILEKIKDIKIG